MIGSVRLKSKSFAFSIASAIDGGAKAAIRARDLAVADERDLGIWGSLANLGIWTRLGCWLEEREIRGLEEAIIELADCSRVFDGSSSTSATLLAAPKSTETSVSQVSQLARFSLFDSSPLTRRVDNQSEESSPSTTH